MMATVPGDPSNVTPMMPKWAQPTPADFLQAAAIMDGKGKFKVAGDVDKSLPYVAGPFVPLQLERSPPAAEGLFQKGMNPPRLNPRTGQPGPDK